MLFKSVLKIPNVSQTQLRLQKQSQKLSSFTNNTVNLKYTCYENNKGYSYSGTPVIILHGLLSSKNSWVWMSEAINRSTGRKVINVDARNHGDSPHYPQNTYVDMAWDTVKLVKKLGLKKVTLLGQSMGGRTAMTMSLLFPDLVSSLIAVDISPVSMSPQMIYNFPHVLDAIHTIDFKGILRVEEAVRHARERMREAGVTQKEVVGFILKNVGIKPDRTVGWIPNVAVLREDFPTLLKFPCIPEKVFHGPALFIRAEEADFLPPEDLPGITAYYPQAQMKCINTGHNIQDEDPSSLLKLTEEFLSRTS